MFFGEVSIDEVEGAILAHSERLDDGSLLKKGIKLSAEDVQKLKISNFQKLTIARLEKEDLGENEAAEIIGRVFVGQNLNARVPFAGRVNIFAKADGILSYNDEVLLQMNLVDESIAIALMKPMSRVKKGQMIGTIKIIPYGVPQKLVQNVTENAKNLQLICHKFHPQNASLILTKQPKMKPQLLQKGEDAVRARVHSLGASINEVIIVEHDECEISDAIKKCKSDLIFILTAAATSDRADKAPAAVLRSGGVLKRFGIPVDPGNLLFLGQFNEKIIVGLPGCVRAPVLNGADIVLERIMAKIDMNSIDFARLGVGGFFKENPVRPMPRNFGGDVKSKDKIAAVILAAGGSTRMRGRDKLLEIVDGEPLLTKIIDHTKASQADDVYVVLPDHGFNERKALIQDKVQIIANPFSKNGLSSSMKIAVQNLGENYDAIIFILADMPEINQTHIDRLISAYSPADDREIIRAASQNGRAGHPVLFGKRFYENLGALEGDEGARAVISTAKDYLEIVRMESDAPIIDLDTPEAWEKWRKNN